MAIMSWRQATDRMHSLQNEELRLIRALSDIRTEMNELSPVSMLPMEVLEEIFAICMSQLLHTGYRPEHHLAWTQVCRSWRSTSLGSARLWTRIDISRWNYASHFLERSGSAPVQLFTSCQKYATHLELPTRRIQSIDFHLFPEDLHDLFTRLGPDLSRLESLTITVPLISANSVLKIIPPPRLKRLTLDCVAIPWNTCLGLSELTHLSLRGLTGSSCPSLRKLLAILEGSPQLECIQLASLSPAMDDFGPVHTRPIRLLSLNHLSIGFKAPVVLAFLSSVILNTKTQLRINTPTFTNLHALLPSHSIPTFKAICPQSLRVDTSEVLLFESAIEPWAGEQTETLVSLVTTWPMVRYIISGLPHFFELSSITAFEVGTFISSGWPFIRLLDHMPKLETLRIASTDFVPHLLLFLAEVNLSSRTSKELRHPMLCPRLRCISFGRHPTCQTSFEEVYFEPLINLLEARRDAASPIETLEFIHLRKLPPDTLDQLQGLVTQINIIPSPSSFDELALPKLPELHTYNISRSL